MFSLQLLMAMDPAQLIKYAALGGAALLAIAFLVGVSKGFREVGKGGLYWLVAGVAFIFLYKMLEGKNPLANILTGKLAEFSSFIWAFVLVVGCIVVTLVLAAACRALFRPLPADDRIRINKGVADGIEYEIEEMEKADYRREKARYIPRRKKPSILGRLFGGVLCVLNLLVIVAIIALFLLTVALNSSFGASLQPVLEGNALLTKVMGLSSQYIFDLVTVGVVFGIARKGFDVGFIGTTRILVRRFGVLIAIIVGFLAPFLKIFDQMALVQSLVAKFSTIFASLGSLSEIVARVAIGAIFAVVLAIVVALLNMLLRKLTYSIEETTVVRVLDGVLAGVVYLILGAVLSVGIWSGVYVANELGVIALKDMIMETPSFARECYSLAESLLAQPLSGVLGKL